MATLAEIRQQYPQYSDMPDDALAGALHKKFYSDMPVDEFNTKLGITKAAVPEPDKYKAAALEEADKYKSSGIPIEAGYARRAIQGATFNGADEILAGLMTPFEMVKRGTFNPAEGYRYAKAREDLQIDEARKNQGILGTAMEIGGGVLSGSGLARSGVSTFGRLAPNAGLGARSLASGADAAGYGAIAGALEGNSLDDRAKNAGFGGLTGGLVGGATPGVMSVAGALLSPVISNISARVAPERFARSQVARSIMESGRPIPQIADDVTTAAREGQDVFTLADALGNPGQRMLSSVTRAPGAGRTEAVNFLEGRQAGQGRRLANTLAEGFDSPQTAAQVQAAATQARDTAANVAYGAARRGASPVDVTRVLSNIDDTISPGVTGVANPGTNIADDSIESVLRRYRGRLTDGQSNLTNYTAVERVRGDLADEVQKAVRAGAGNRARLLGQALREMDTAMESASPGFRQANRDFSAASRVIDAVDEGRLASVRGRSEDVIRDFRGRPAAQQDTFRSGYVDPLISQVQGPASGVNKARQFTSDAFRDEAAAIAPMRTQPLLGRGISQIPAEAEPLSAFRPLLAG